MPKNLMRDEISPWSEERDLIEVGLARPERDLTRGDRQKDRGKKGQVLIHQSVKERWDQDPEYRPRNLVDYLSQFNWPIPLVS